MKRINLISGLVVLIMGILMIISVNDTTVKTYELIITDENGKSTTVILTDTDEDGQLEFSSYKR